MEQSNITDNPNLIFSDLSDEQWRRYEFGNGDYVEIPNPIALNVSKSMGHRVLDSEGLSHYIPPYWNHLVWKVKEGKKPFAF